MRKIKIYLVGKTKERWLEEALSEYEKRLTPFCSLEWIVAKDDPHLLDLLKHERELIALDPAGELMTSEKFSKFIASSPARLTLVIGGADGLPPEIRSRGKHLSLSPLTFTHQITRLVLAEQLYRAFQIDAGTPYHRA